MDHHHYFLEPTTEVNLYQNMMSRNFIASVNGKHYFANGQTEDQQDDVLTVEAGLLYQKITRNSKEITFEITSFVAKDETVELHEVILTNPTQKDINVSFTTAIPIYGRSADNLRDHRHVTSLLTQINVLSHGILNQPTLSFDERGHKVNHHVYSVFAQSDKLNVKGYIPVLDDFIAGGSMHYPKGLNQLVNEGYTTQGYEAMGAIQFEDVTLKQNESVTFYISLGIHESKGDALKSLSFLNKTAFYHELDSVQSFFNDYVSGLKFDLIDETSSKALSWVVLQPMLRRYLGNSYLPHHDYGRGGKGWRDLWQDLLALIMMNDSSVTDLLFNNFLGVRLDGSNATIIGDQPGEFKADRNMITRVWSDHGAWPLLTVNMYIDETGDLDFLLKKQGYFQDQFTHYTKKTQKYTSPRVMTSSNHVYEGTILEHLLLQNLVGHHNIGDHGFVRLEDADWNDGLDMAHTKGETIAFTHMYADNLRRLADLIEALDQQEIEVFKELNVLLDEKVNLDAYFDSLSSFTGKTIRLNKQDVVNKLRVLAEKRIEHLRKHAFNHGRYQSYFNNEGIDVDSKDSMNLTGQAISLLSKTPTDEQAFMVSQTTKTMLFDEKVGGYHLNTNYHKLLTNMGRAYGFAYGHKENGAVFSHMVMMYAYGLYQYGLVSLGRQAWKTLFDRALHEDSKVFAGIPEYFSDRGIGMYPYLTGSASWFLKLLRTEVFGIQMRLGKLYLEPQLAKSDFNNGKASIETYLFGKLVKVTYYNPKGLDAGSYQIKSIYMNYQAVSNGLDHITGPIEVNLDEVR